MTETSACSSQQTSFLSLSDLMSSQSPERLMFYLSCPQILKITDPSLSQSNSLTCADLIAFESSEQGISRPGKSLFYASLQLLKMHIRFNENSVIPQRKQMGNCAGVRVCISVHACIRNSVDLPLLSAGTCSYLRFVTVFIFLYSTNYRLQFIFFVCVQSYVCTCIYNKRVWGFEALKV